MQKFFVFFLLAFGFLSLNATAQDLKKAQVLPDVSIQDTDGKTLSAKDIANTEGATILSFWATWCRPCIKELDAVNDALIDWKEDFDFKVVAVSVDDARNAAKVKTFSEGRGWDFEIYQDINQDLKRQLNVNNVPHVFILNKKGEIIWQHTSYKAGDEEEYYEVLEKLAHEEGE